jgi:cytochrome c-type biogenesis protein CcmE
VAITTPPDGDVGAESADAPDADFGPLGPVGAAGVKPRRGLGSRRRQIVAFGIIAAALGVLVFRGLGNATVYFKTADEAVAARAKLGSQRFRIEGTVQPGVVQVGQNVAFVIANNGVNVNVVHSGGAPQLFKPGIPVVLEGHFMPNGVFASDLIMVKHTSSYDAKHPERVTTVPAPAPAT